MKESQLSVPLELTFFAISSTTSKDSTMKMFRKPSIASLTSPNKLQALGATDITDHEVVKKLLRSLDSSFDTLALMIQERGDYKSLDPADILERLNTHEFQLAEKRDLL